MNAVTKLRVPQNAANLNSSMCRAVNYFTAVTVTNYFTAVTVTNAYPYKLQFINICHVSVCTGHLHQAGCRGTPVAEHGQCAVIILKCTWRVKYMLKCNCRDTCECMLLVCKS